LTSLLPLAAETPSSEARSLVLVLAAASAGAILSRLHRRVVLPTVVLEIVLGILIGPEVLDIAEVGDHVEFLSDLGLVFLFFFAGLEVVEHRVARRSLVRGTIGWAISLALGLGVGLLLHAGGLDAEAWLLGVALSTTALERSYRFSRTPACCRRRWARRCSGAASPASSGRSWSSPSS
jgi:Kef-type K+ transport system membrane component KefB